MNILIVDCNIVTQWGAPDLQRQVACAPAGGRVAFQVRRAPQSDLPRDSSAFDAIIVSGSKTRALEDAPWISELHRFVESWLATGKPYLGICYGHQTLCRILGARERKLTVRESLRPEYGWKEIETISPSPILAGLPRKFWAYESHQDEVHELADGLRNLARTNDCEIQAVQWKDGPVFGLQFHPEVTPATAENSRAHANRHNPKVAQAIFTQFFALTPSRADGKKTS